MIHGKADRRLTGTLPRPSAIRGIDPWNQKSSADRQYLPIKKVTPADERRDGAVAASHQFL